MLQYEEKLNTTSSNYVIIWIIIETQYWYYIHSFELFKNIIHYGLTWPDRALLQLVESLLLIPSTWPDYTLLELVETSRDRIHFELFYYSQTTHVIESTSNYFIITQTNSRDRIHFELIYYYSNLLTWSKSIFGLLYFKLYYKVNYLTWLPNTVEITEYDYRWWMDIRGKRDFYWII